MSTALSTPLYNVNKEFAIQGKLFVNIIIQYRVFTNRLPKARFRLFLEKVYKKFTFIASEAIIFLGNLSCITVNFYQISIYSYLSVFLYYDILRTYFPERITHIHNKLSESAVSVGIAFP